MTIQKFTTAAQQAHDTLTPLLAQAIEDTQAILNEAKQAASIEPLRPELIDMLNSADTPPADSVASILSGYCDLLPAHSGRDSGLLIRSLVSTKSYRALSDKQAGQIAGAIIASIHGKAPQSLTEWPAAEDWHKQLHDSDLQLWAAWAAPEKYSKFKRKIDTHTESRMSAESDLMQLEVSQQALAELVPTPSAGHKIVIRNNAEHRQGIAGIQWQPGEEKPLTSADYAVLTSSTGYEQLTQDNVLEVVA